MRGSWTFITGASGFVGHYVLAELLRRGVPCVVLVRNQGEKRIAGLLQEIAPEVPHDAASLRTMQGTLPDDLPEWDGPKIERVVHVAASTTFRTEGEEPARTNVRGTARLLAWMDAHGIADLTHVSTAYVCGTAPGCAVERIERLPPRFQNDYEATKWLAEQLVSDWAARGRRRLVVARPSIVTGEHATGRATEFRGLYVIARAVEQLARSYEGRPRADRLSIPLRLRGAATAPNQIVPVDFVARAIASLALNPGASGVFHLTHPQPPSNDDIRRMLEAIFDVAGGRFVGNGDIPASSQSREEQAFYGGMQPLAAYFSHSPRFDCSRTVASLDRSLLPPKIDLPYLRRCVAYAQARRWGRARREIDSDAARFGAAYFERFLPSYLPQSLVSRVRPIRATIRFIVDQCEWVCRFADGQLHAVQPGCGDSSEQFGYRTSAAGFWRAISGRVEGEELFASGEADVFGDVETALKMSAILREFTREFPCDRARLESFVVRA